MHTVYYLGVVTILAIKRTTVIILRTDKRFIGPYLENNLFEKRERKATIMEAPER